MVSDALVQFGVGFADAFGRERRPYFDALAREEANKKGINITDPDAREHVYGMSYTEWKEKYQK